MEREGCGVTRLRNKNSRIFLILEERRMGIALSNKANEYIVWWSIYYKRASIRKESMRQDSYEGLMETSEFLCVGRDGSSQKNGGIGIELLINANR
jgi:hypothetical protein